MKILGTKIRYDGAEKAAAEQFPSAPSLSRAVFEAFGGAPTPIGRRILRDDIELWFSLLGQVHQNKTYLSVI